MTKPHIVCHMVSSLDGRLSPSNWTASPDGNRNDWSAAYAAIHEKLKGEAWIVGRVTMAEMAKGVPHAPAVNGEIERPLYLAPHGHAPYAIALDASGKLHFDRADIDGDHIVVLLGRDVSDSHLAELKADGISYIVSQSTQVELPAMLDVLRGELGIRRLLLEGGGGINGSFFAAGLVDELSVIVAPALDGRSGGKSIVDSGEVGLAGKVELSLTSCDKLEHGAIHLLYAVKPNQPKC
ncbi:RibD family protein [Rhodopseudomonas rhenobacensis]|nr:RibD family protein [Rhodopseudomonas rhenobacensis]